MVLQPVLGSDAKLLSGYSRKPASICSRISPVNWTRGQPCAKSADAMGRRRGHFRTGSRRTAVSSPLGMQIGVTMQPRSSAFMISASPRTRQRGNSGCLGRRCARFWFATEGGRSGTPDTQFLCFGMTPQPLISRNGQPHVADDPSFCRVGRPRMDMLFSERFVKQECPVSNREITPHRAPKPDRG